VAEVPNDHSDNDQPGSTIGILGGGQLGRMLALAAITWVIGSMSTRADQLPAVMSPPW
jgi:hypothetical protein